jgi:hypothetical protein
VIQYTEIWVAEPPRAPSPLQPSFGVVW